MMSGKVPFLVRMGPVWQPVDLPFVVRLVPISNPPCTHVDADQDLPPRVVRLHVRDWWRRHHPWRRARMGYWERRWLTRPGGRCLGPRAAAAWVGARSRRRGGCG